MREVWELTIDWDGTTRSKPRTEGLFLSERSLNNYLDNLRRSGAIWFGKEYILRRKVNP